MAVNDWSSVFLVSNPHFGEYKPHRSELLRIGGSWSGTFSFQISRLFPDSLIPESGPKDRFLDQATPPILIHGPVDSQAIRGCQETGRHRFSDPPPPCSLNRRD